MDTTTMSPEHRTDYHRRLFEEQLELRKPYVSKTPDGVWQFRMSKNELAKGVRVGGVVGCVDERVDCDLNLAGALALLDLEAAAELLAPRVLSGEITTITSHDGCGAAALAGIDGEEFARQLAQLLSEKTGIQVAHEHIPFEKMHGPNDVHNATVVYLTGSGFRPRRNENAPAGFSVNPYLHPNTDYTVTELKVIADIAFSDHGLKDHFTTNHPLLIVPMGSPTNGFHHDELAGLAHEVFVGDPRPIVVARGIEDLDAVRVSA